MTAEERIKELYKPVVSPRTGRIESRTPAYHEILAAVREAEAAARAEERERCAKVAEGGHFLHDDAPTARFGREVAAAIRREAVR